MEAQLIAIIGWLSPIISAIIIAAATTSINSHAKRQEMVADERHAETEAKRAADAKWQESVTQKLDSLTDATQTTMRTTLLHYVEKYLTRGWVTPEERASLYDMHQKYSALDANGYIDGYIDRVMALPDKEV